LKAGVSTRQDVIRLFGKPTQYLWGDKTFQEDNLPKIYVAVFPNGPHIVCQGDVIDEIRFEEQDFGYVFRGKIRIGSSLDDVLAVLAKPRETVVGDAFGWKDGVLWQRRRGPERLLLYFSAQDHAHVLFRTKVMALYLDRRRGYGGMLRRGQVKKTCGLRRLSLGGSERSTSRTRRTLTTLYLNQQVKWPEGEMPADFRPDDSLQEPP
jgi:hypothetical protein